MQDLKADNGKKMSELNYTKRGIVQRKFNTPKLSLK